MKGRWFSEEKTKVDRGRLPEEIKIEENRILDFLLYQQRLSSQLRKWRNHVAYLVVHSFAVLKYLQSRNEPINKRSN